MIQYLLILTLVLKGVPALLSNGTFPENFIFGVTTSAYQIEGGWNEGGKGLNIFDYYCHKEPDRLANGANGDVACDSYHKWREDVQLLKDLGVNFYRFSISWTRIVPSGYKNSKISDEGVQFYSDFIDALLAEGITPYVTIFHSDLPMGLQEKGGWLNETIIEDYVFYARTLFQLYGDRVKHWTTFNELAVVCEVTYDTGLVPPFTKIPDVGAYQCAHTTLQAHGQAYRLYDTEFRPTQGGKVGMALDSIWCDESGSDEGAGERYLQFNLGWFLHPLVIGNYPPVMIETVDANSKRQGYKESRLPKFTPEQINMLKGSLDFFGLNHYGTDICVFQKNPPSEPSFPADCAVDRPTSDMPHLQARQWSKYHPEGFRKLLGWIKNTYNNLPVIILENGWKEQGPDMEDTSRIHYLKGYLSALLDAIHYDGCNVYGYAIWSLLDSFEWVFGYTAKFGLVHVDFDSPNRTRTPKASYSWYKGILESRIIE